MSEDAELLEVFARELSEASDELARITEALQALDSSDPREHLRAAFRVAHNIKGAARAAGAGELESLTHGLEDLLSHFLEHAGPVPQALLDQMLAAVVIMDRGADGESIAAEVEILLEMFATLRGDPDDEHAPRSPAQPEPQPEPTPAGSSSAASADTLVGATTLRVESKRLDRAMDHTGEFLATVARGQARLLGADELVDEFRAAIAALPAKQQPRLRGLLRRLEQRVQTERLDQLRFTWLVDSFNDTIKRVRMVPLAALDKQWRAVLRSAVDTSGKRARLQLAVGAIEIDKHVIDELRDPFVHLLRNAVDHGLEHPAIRRDRGKPETGVVTIAAQLAGTRVRIEVSDDGGGLSRELIGRRAVDTKLTSEAQLEHMSDAEVHDLLFGSGFSTTGRVSRLSGRGLGLDVVRQRVEALGGEVEIGPGPAGLGTRVCLTVPTTMVSTTGLLVRTSGNVHALPLNHVVRALRVRADSLEQVDGGVAVRSSDGEPLRVHWLAALLSEPRGVDPEQLTIVVVSDGRGTIGLVVNELLGELEFTAKPLPWNLGELPGISGVMTRADGELAIVVDLPQLIDRARHERGAGQRLLAAGPQQRPTILVVDDSLTSRTLERNILSAAGYEVAVACDGEQAWRHLQARTVDLVVTDIEMPQLDGIALTRRIRASEALAELPVILVSSLEGPEDRAAGAAAGADEYVIKGSFDQRVLLEAVARLI